MNNNRQPNQQLVRLPEPSEMGSLVVRNVTSFARRNKTVTGFYLLGWVFLLFVGSGTRLTVQQQATYNRIVETIDVQAEYDATVRIKEKSKAATDGKENQPIHGERSSHLCLLLLFVSLLFVPSIHTYSTPLNNHHPQTTHTHQTGRLLASPSNVSIHQGLVFFLRRPVPTPQGPHGTGASHAHGHSARRCGAHGGCQTIRGNFE